MKYPFLLACCLLVGTAAGAPPSPAAPAGGAATTPPKTTVSLDFVQTPLRQALATLFNELGVQYVIAPDVPDVPITMNVRDAPFAAALWTMLRLAGHSINRPGGGAVQYDVTYRKEGDVYVVGLRRASPPPEESVGPGATQAAPPAVEKIPINFLRPKEAELFLMQQQVPPGIVSIQPLSRDNSVVVRGDPDAIRELKRLIQLVDVPSRPLSVSVGISGPGLNGTPLAIRSTARTLAGDDVTIDEQSVLGEHPAHLKVTLRTQLLGTGDLQIANDWDVSVPIAGGPRGPIRLVKRLSTTTQLRTGEQASVAEVDLSGWGGRGVLRLWIRGDWGGSAPGMRSAR